jgi:hypothetical protein
MASTGTMIFRMVTSGEGERVFCEGSHDTSYSSRTEAAGAKNPYLGYAHRHPRL